MKYSKIAVLILFIFSLNNLFAQAGRQKINVEKVCEYINKLEILHPEIVLKQSILETGWYKSKFLMSKNNLFGFKYKGRYLRFKTWKESVEYYKRWQQRHYKNEEEDYYKFLLRIHYANGKKYNKALKSIKLNKTCI